MTSKTFIAALVAVQIVALPQIAQAQSSDFGSGYNGAFHQQGAEARLSFSIPLGARADRAKMKPRLEFAVRNYASSPNRSVDWMLADKERFTEARIGFTLESNPQLMLNDQPLRLGPENDQANIGTVGKIGIGVAAVVLVGVAVIAATFAECDSDPGGCFGED